MHADTEPSGDGSQTQAGGSPASGTDTSANSDPNTNANKGPKYVRLFRAVTSDERSDIQQSGVYRNAGPRLNKFFSDDPNTAIRFGQMLEDNGDGPIFLTSGKFPRSLLFQTTSNTIHEGPEIMIPNELLDQFKPGSVIIHGWIGNFPVP